MNEIKIGGAKLNKALKIGLDKNSYIKTRGYKGHKIKRKAKSFDPENTERIENDVSFNYAQTDFKFEEQSN